jgi:hypothetical protein
MWTGSTGVREEDGLVSTNASTFLPRDDVLRDVLAEYPRAKQRNQVSRIRRVTPWTASRPGWKGGGVGPMTNEETADHPGDGGMEGDVRDTLSCLGTRTIVVAPAGSGP